MPTEQIAEMWEELRQELLADGDLDWTPTDAEIQAMYQYVVGCEL